MMRDEFEQWIINTPFFGVGNRTEEDLVRDPEDGGYLDAVVHGAWLAFLFGRGLGS